MFVRRSRLFTTPDKKLSTGTQICNYFVRDVYKSNVASRRSKSAELLFVSLVLRRYYRANDFSIDFSDWEGGIH